MELNSEINLRINLQLTEVEARAFYALCTYSGVPFDMKKSLLQLIKELPEHLDRIENARKLFNNELITRKPSLDELFGKIPTNIEQPPPPPPNLYKAIEDCDFSTGCFNILKAIKVNTLGDLAKITPQKLLSIRYFGQQSLKEVRKTLLDNHIDWEKYMEK